MKADVEGTFRGTQVLLAVFIYGHFLTIGFHCPSHHHIRSDRSWSTDVSPLIVLKSSSLTVKRPSPGSYWLYS